MDICICTYNRRLQLERCINSIVKQTYKNIRLFILDNGSNDQTSNYLFYIREELPSTTLVLLNDPEPNAMITLNNLFYMTTSKYIMVMDDDAWFKDNDAIERLVTDIERSDDIGVVGSRVIGIDGKPHIKCRRNTLYVSHEFHGACAIFNREHFLETGLYDNSFIIYVNELDVSCKMSIHGYNILIDPNVIVYHNEMNVKRCNMRKIQFIKNYNKIILRYFNRRRLYSVLYKDTELYLYFLKHNMIGKCNMIDIIKFTGKWIAEIFKSSILSIITKCNVIFPMQETLIECIR
jgi:GT2 family glycosyltransferase